jgi:hypothetical protein
MKKHMKRIRILGSIDASVSMAEGTGSPTQWVIPPERQRCTVRACRFEGLRGRVAVPSSARAFMHSEGASVPSAMSILCMALSGRCQRAQDDMSAISESKRVVSEGTRFPG